jgi:transcriptional regulator with XRE-family HTH domain
MSGIEERSAVGAAVRKLRHALGETQEKFARRMNTAVRTIARYEGERPPTGLALAQLKRLADAYNLPDVGNVLEDAIMRELGQDDMRDVSQFYTITLVSPEEIGPVRALVEALRNARYREVGVRAIRVLTPVMNDIQKPIDQARRAAQQGEAMLAACRAGKTDRQIAKFFGVSVKEVREWKRASGLTDQSEQSVTK